MSSSVFFKFKSSKEPTLITFDGTGISVFELKQEIISISGLGDGTDFDLAIYNEETNEEYHDDTTIIPRATSIIARRLPASKPGHGRAARYVSGKKPVAAKNSYRTESSNSKLAIQGKSAGPASAATAMSEAQTEEDRIAAMFKAGAEQWEQQQQQMASQKPVLRGGYKNKPVNVPDHDPPPGYICYRCHEKGHWIQACPTNDDPNFENKPRIKRTTGIPRSFLRTIDKPAALNNEGSSDESRHPSGVMVNAEGEYVIAEPDKASWERYQAKAQASAAQQEAAAADSKELQERGLECPLDKRMFVDPMKTPCCGKTYCNDCIENALVNSDLVCPNCSKEGVLIDDLVPDEETIDKLKAYENEKAAAAKKAKEGSKSPASVKADPVVTDEKPKESTEAPALNGTKSKSPSPSRTESVKSSTETVKPTTSTASNKRPAEEELENNRVAAPPTTTQKQADTQQPSSKPGSEQAVVSNTNNSIPTTMPNQLFTNASVAPLLSMNDMSFPNSAMMGMGMSMGPMMGMPPGMMNPMMMMQNGVGPWPTMAGMGGMGPMPFQQQNGMFGGFGNGMTMPNGGYGQQGWPVGQGWGMNGAGYPQQQQQHRPQQQQRPHQQQGMQNMRNGPKAGVFPNQQRTVFSEPFPNEEDDAYFRKPVNPHRHQHRQRRVRPSDYREL